MWNLIRKVGKSERRSDQRTPAPELDASYSTESERKSVRIKDISATGIYLLTEDPLQPGTDVDLTLRKCSSADGEKEEGLSDYEALQLNYLGEDQPVNVHLRAKAVRVGQDGVGIAFELNSEKTTWTRLMGVLANLTGETDRVRLFRVNKALSFVLRISPAAEEEVLQMVSSRVSLEQVGRLVDIALMAEEIASARNDALRHDVSSKLVLRILQDGAKVDEERTRRMWAEVLAASCYQDANEDEILNHVVLLSRLDAVQMRIFDAACRRAMQAGWEQGFSFRQDLHCGADEVKKITHIQNMMAIERDLNHLYELGLMELTVRPVLCQEVERVNLTPTSLALKLYAQCKGQPEPPEMLEGASLQKAS